jgi:hypothetical protein
MSKVFRSEARTLCDAGQHLVTNFFVLVESEHVVSVLSVLKFECEPF